MFYLLVTTCNSMFLKVSTAFMFLRINRVEALFIALNRCRYKQICTAALPDILAPLHPSPRKNGYPLKNNKLELPTGNREFKQLRLLRRRLRLSEILFIAVFPFSRFVDFGFTMWLNKRIMKSAFINVINALTECKY